MIVPPPYRARPAGLSLCRAPTCIFLTTVSTVGPGAYAVAAETVFIGGTDVGALALRHLRSRTPCSLSLRLRIPHLCDDLAGGSLFGGISQNGAVSAAARGYSWDVNELHCLRTPDHSLSRAVAA